MGNLRRVFNFLKSLLRIRKRELKIDTETIRYDVVYRNVSHPRLQVTDEGVVKLILPSSTDASPESLIFSKRKWILEKIRELRELSSLVDECRGSENKLLLFGKFYEVKTGSGSEKANVSLGDGEIIVNLSKGGKLYKHLRRWVKKTLFGVLSDRLHKYEELMGVKVKKMYIRNLQKKWGSRSGEGNVSFNLMLAAVPRDLVECVVAHELTHFLEPKHGRNFHRLLESFCPNYEEKERLLAKYRLLVERNLVWRNLLAKHDG